MAYRPRYLDRKRHQKKLRPVNFKIASNGEKMTVIYNNGDTLVITAEKIEHHSIEGGIISGWFSSGKIFN